MTSFSSSDSFEMADYLGVLRRRWWILLVLTCVGALVAGAGAELAAKNYTATASVSVSDLTSTASQASSRAAGTVNMDDEAQLVHSQKVATLAAKQLTSGITPAALAKKITVTVPANTTVLDIHCARAKALEAAACANAVAAAYLSVRLADATGAIAKAVNAIQSQANALSARVAALQAAQSALTAKSAGYESDQLKLNTLRPQLNGLISQLNLLQPQLTSLRAPNNTLAGQVITPATTPRKPSSLGVDILLPSGALAALLIGLIIAFVVDARDDRIHSARDVERFLGLPVLVDIADPGRGPGLVPPLSDVGRAFTELAHYAAASLGEDGRVLLVAATSPGASGSMVAANLAGAVARVRAGVVLVCADPHSAAPAMLGVGAGAGLAELLAGRAALGEVVGECPDLPQLRVIGPGGASGLGSPLHHDAVLRVLTELRSVARYVVIEARALGVGAESLALAEFAKVAVVAVETDGTTRRDASDCLARLSRLGATALGGAVVPASRRRSRAHAPAGTRDRAESVGMIAAGQYGAR